MARGWRDDAKPSLPSALLRVARVLLCVCVMHPFSKKDLNASKPSEHPPNKGGELLKRLVGGNIGCKNKKLFITFNRVPQW